ncbi:hypothetical protein CGGC5_v006184 [Colletotrichum fructicola Nara gc5]|uniref:Uncharacterized protein n=1 Tax=Colletotrichum fructicola (strain Nara gc5) TaxID=1213859 RepID=A0A7J6JCW3_COLFN|nr:hypothetical protein CGGC5_v006184 [Colletotrichum fructicola Nara gc5]KAI8279402.1 hypothetical protein K4K60_005616 [Colletotrichum sp. SAR11_57]
MLASSTGALADKGISLHNVYGSFEAHPILFQRWAATLPKWLSTGDMVVLPHRVIRGVNPQAVNAALDDIGKGGGVRREGWERQGPPEGYGVMGKKRHSKD